MMNTVLRRLTAVTLLVAGVLAGSAFVPAASAQVFPAKPVTLICPWPPGGSTDIHLRKMAELASKHLGQQVVVENRPGGSGMNGPATMAKTAAGAGYIGVAGYTFGIVVKSDSPLKSFQDLIDYARANPGKLSYATPGTGTSLHLAMEEIGAKTGVQFLHIPFKGYAEGATALLGGHVMAHVDSTGWARHVDAGTMRLLATLGDKRTRWNAPTVAELGVDTVSNSPYGFVAPKGVPPHVVKILHDAFKAAMDEPENLKTLQMLDQNYWYKSSDDYRKWAQQTLVAERATIERVGLLLK
jgi:tripartite-type tricarboxylate transporter receptor subunit TctC